MGFPNLGFASAIMKNEQPCGCDRVYTILGNVPELHLSRVRRIRKMPIGKELQHIGLSPYMPVSCPCRIVLLESKDAC